MVNDHPEDATVAEGPDGEGEAVLPGACGDGEPARAVGECSGKAAIRAGREGGGVGDGEGAADRWFLPRKRSRRAAIRGVAGRASGRRSAVDGWTVRYEGYGLEPAGEGADGRIRIPGAPARQRVEAGNWCY